MGKTEVETHKQRPVFWLRETMSRKSVLVEYEHLIGGLAGGLTSTLVCHPMDLLKIRYSANEGNPMRPQYTSYWDATKRIVSGGGVRALYQGLVPNTLGATLSWGLYFHMWAFHLLSILQLSLDEGTARLRPTCLHIKYRELRGGLCCGLLRHVSDKPDLGGKDKYETEQRKYRGTIHCLRRIAVDEGFRGLYRGFVPGLMGNAHGALQFALYNYFKDRRCKALGVPSDTKLVSSLPSFEVFQGTVDYLAFSTWSKVLATTLTYPYQVLRTRMQDHHVEKRSVLETIVLTVRGEGAAGLYKGLLMANVRQLPSAIVTFLTYENVKHFIRDL